MNRRQARTRDVMAALETLAPRGLALEEDRENIGLQVGDPQTRVSRVLVALDATLPVIEEAAETGCERLVTHQPLSVGGLKRVRWDERVGRCVAALCSRGVGLLCAHTNLDAARGGVNDALCAALGLENIADMGDLGRVGALHQAMAPGELQRWVGGALGGSPWLVPGSEAIRRVAVVGGAGGEFLGAALEAGAQALVTGELKHHEALEARHLGLTAVMAGHHATEVVAVPALANGLQKALDALEYGDVIEIGTSKRAEDPFVW